MGGVYLRGKNTAMTKLGWLAFGALALTMMTGCSGGDTAKGGETTGSASSTGASGGTQGKTVKVAVVFDQGGRGDKSFNDSAWRGVEKAQKELGAEVQYVESKSENDYETNLRAMADKGVDLVIAVGLNQESALSAVAPEYPNVKFAIVDGHTKGDNVRDLLFSEQEGSFLVGYLAGEMTKNNKIGFVGGQELDLIKKFQYGYAAGAKTANSAVEILPAKYTGDWNNIDKAKAAANILFDGGADIVYHAAGRAGMGVIRAAEEKNKFAIGVDSDQDGEAQGHVLTSMIKHVDAAVFATIKDVQDGNFSAGEKSYSLADDGVGISDLTYTKDLIGPDKLAKLDEVKAKIVSGEIKVPSTEAEYTAYVAGLK